MCEKIIAVKCNFHSLAQKYLLTFYSLVDILLGSLIEKQNRDSALEKLKIRVRAEHVHVSMTKIQSWLWELWRSIMLAKIKPLNLEHFEKASWGDSIWAENIRIRETILRRYYYHHYYYYRLIFIKFLTMYQALCSTIHISYSSTQKPSVMVPTIKIFPLCWWRKWSLQRLTIAQGHTISKWQRVKLIHFFHCCAVLRMVCLAEYTANAMEMPQKGGSSCVLQYGSH